MDRVASSLNSPMSHAPESAAAARRFSTMGLPTTGGPKAVIDGPNSSSGTEGRLTRWDQEVAIVSSFTPEQAEELGRRIGIDWDQARFDVEQFRRGLDVELEHGTRDPETNVSNDDPLTTARIALAHLNEFPDYYTRLAVMEGEAEAYWEDK